MSVVFEKKFGLRLPQNVCFLLVKNNYIQQVPTKQYSLLRMLEAVMQPERINLKQTCLLSLTHMLFLAVPKGHAKTGKKPWVGSKTGTTTTKQALNFALSTLFLTQHLKVKQTKNQQKVEKWHYTKKNNDVLHKCRCKENIFCLHRPQSPWIFSSAVAPGGSGAGGVASLLRHFRRRGRRRTRWLGNLKGKMGVSLLRGGGLNSCKKMFVVLLSGFTSNSPYFMANFEQSGPVQGPTV